MPVFATRALKMCAYVCNMGHVRLETNLNGTGEKTNFEKAQREHMRGKAV